MRAGERYRNRKNAFLVEVLTDLSFIASIVTAFNKFNFMQAVTWRSLLWLLSLQCRTFEAVLLDMLRDHFVTAS